MNRFTLLSYNIHRAIGIDRRFRLDRILQILDYYNADIILLQEVDNGVPRSKKLNLAREIVSGLNYPYHVFSHNVDLKYGQYGNCTISNFPIVKQNNIDLTIGRKKKRGCQHTSLRLNLEPGSFELEVFNLHLGLSAKERQKQASILFNSDEYRSIKPKTPCIIGGDFNDWRSLLSALFIVGMDFKCATEHMVNNRLKGINTYPSFAPQGALDKIYYKGALKLESAYRSRLAKARIASDHLPVISHFIIGGS